MQRTFHPEKSTHYCVRLFSLTEVSCQVVRILLAEHSRVRLQDTTNARLFGSKPRAAESGQPQFFDGRVACPYFVDTRPETHGLSPEPQRTLRRRFRLKSIQAIGEGCLDNLSLPTAHARTRHRNVGLTADAEDSGGASTRARAFWAAWFGCLASSSLNLVIDSGLASGLAIGSAPPRTPDTSRECQ